MSTNRISPVSFLKLSADVASFYGFRPAREVERAAAKYIKDERARIARGPHTFATTAAMSAAWAVARPQEPVLAFYATPSPSHLPYGFPARETGEFGLQIVGTSESVGEIMLFKTLAAILSEWGAPLARVRVNAIGDRDSRERFLRELTLHVRKHSSRFEPAERDLLAQNSLLLYHFDLDLAREVRAEAPRSINFLSEKSRTHFRSVLEHLEQLGFLYELDDSLVGDERGHHLAFAIDTTEADATIIATMGGRYDEYLRTHGRKAGSAGVGASIFFRKKGAVASNFSTNRATPKPKVYFAQLGLRAKLQGLSVVEMLRAARIPVEQSFDAAHLSTQLQAAQSQGVSHLLIMGQREAIDGTIIVRSMQNSAQSTLQLADMPRFLKSLR
ncbi:hypothetical protein H7X87_00690 [Acetobacteraceae bacterium]|nr:hypothetical protein [Candidatus Parcubacteria bacterium]